jgi:uncharacterized membrane protein
MPNRDRGTLGFNFVIELPTWLIDDDQFTYAVNKELSEAFGVDTSVSYKANAQQTIVVREGKYPHYSDNDQAKIIVERHIDEAKCRRDNLNDI